MFILLVVGVNAVSISNTIPSEINTYSINFSNYISLTDSNVGNFTIDGVTYGLGYSVFGTDNDVDSFVFDISRKSEIDRDRIVAEIRKRASDLYVKKT